MAHATVSLIGDRLHAINQLLSVSGYAIKSRRYFPNEINTGIMPLLVPMWGRQGIAVPTAGAAQFQGGRLWEIRLYAGDWMMGYPSESAQKAAEAIVDPLIALYVARPRLALADGGNELDGVLLVEMQEDSGLTSDETGTIALVRLPLLIQARYSFSYV